MTELVLAIFGPTASGKSAVAEEVAARVPAQVISADALQAYRGLPLLTNQPQRTTRLVGVWPLEHEGSVGEYQRLAHAAIDEVLAAGETPIVAGGTGLYLRAALAEIGLPSPPRAGARERWEQLYDEAGAEPAHAELRRRDAEAANVVHPNDRRRVVRALELAEAGSTLRPMHDRLWSGASRHPTVVFGLEVPRDLLSSRIETRARAMFDAGVEEEVRGVLHSPLSRTAAAALGLREIAELPREEAIAALIRRTRSYAAYQRKWMRRVPGLVSVDANRSPGPIADEILDVARARQRLPAGRAL